MVLMSISNVAVSIYVSKRKYTAFIFEGISNFATLFTLFLTVSLKNQENRNGEAERRLFDRILKYTGVFGSVQGVSMVVTLVINMVKSRLLGPVGYGITESLNRTTDLVKNSTNLGITTVAVPEISRYAGDADGCELADKVRLTRSWALLTAILGMAVCLILAPVLSRYAFDGDNSSLSLKNSFE